MSAPAQNLANFGTLLAAQTANQVTLFNVADPAAPALLLSGGPSGCLWFDLTKADGAVDRGLWLPLGAYGVSAIPLAKTPSP